MGNKKSHKAIELHDQLISICLIVRVFSANPIIIKGHIEKDSLNKSRTNPESRIRNIDCFG